MSDILTDYREWRDKQPERIGTHSDRCHMWQRHERCMIHRLAAALAAEMAKRTPSEPSTPSEGTRQAECTLTDAERAAIEWAAAKSDAESQIAEAAAERGYIPEIGGDPRQWARNHAARAAALRSLLDRI